MRKYLFFLLLQSSICLQYTQFPPKNSHKINLPSNNYALENNLRLVPLISPVITNNLPSLSHISEQIDIYDICTIESLYRSLIKPLKYLSITELESVRIAIIVAYLAHYEQKRPHGEMFIMHPISVATILADLKVDSSTIISALLHDTLHKTLLTSHEIENLFGLSICRIVQGVTKASNLSNSNIEQIPSQEEIINTKTMRNEYLRHLMLSITKDWRILYIKLTDRLHNMRTLEHLPIEKQTKIATETFEIYVPLAKRVGFWKYGSELEDLTFKYINPNAYNQSFHAIHNMGIFQKNYVEEIKTILDSQLADIDTDFSIEGRTKSIFSSWKKSEKYNSNIQDLLDIVAIRIVINTNKDEQIATNLCFSILSKVHQLWKPLPKTFKDYINSPKENGYQSLHTTVFFDENFPIEIQIKTRKMHRVATFGSASHWSYKSDRKSESWNKYIKELDSEIYSNKEFAQIIRQKLLDSRVFVFVPNGNILNIKKGDTIHDIYDSLPFCIKEGRNILVNFEKKPHTYILNNGDIIDFQDNC